MRDAFGGLAQFTVLILGVYLAISSVYYYFVESPDWYFRGIIGLLLLNNFHLLDIKNKIQEKKDADRKR